MRRFIATALFAALASGPMLVANTAADAVDRSPSATKVRTVALGHDPIKVGLEQGARLRFEGDRGDLVNLARWSMSDIAESTPRGRRTLRLDGTVVAPFADGYWRLPADGDYVVTWRPDKDAIDAYGKIALQLREAVRKDVTIGGPVVRFPSRADRTYLARVRLADTRIRLRSTGELDHVTSGPGLTIEPIGGHDLFLELGTTIHSDDVRSWLHGTQASSGTYLVTVAPGSRVELSTPETTPITLDGPRTAPRSTALHEQLFTFDGVAGQVVHPESTDPNAWQHELTGPDGDLVAGIGLLPGWELPTTGTYTLSARAVDTAGRPGDVTVRLRTATPGPAITVGGAPVRFQPTEPGRWVVSRIQTPATPAYGWSLDAANGSADPTWHTAATTATRLLCPFESTANGCGSQVGAVASSSAPSNPFDLLPQPGTSMLVIYDPGTSGSTAPVDLTVRSN